MTVPPAGYSGLEQLCWQQAAGLAKKGHDVMLVAPIGSVVPNGVELHGTTLGEGDRNAYRGYSVRLNGMDVVIDHSWEKWAYMGRISGELKAPVLGVLHAPCDTMYRSAPPTPFPCLVAISEDQASHARELWGVNVRVCHNGIDMDFYKPLGQQEKQRYLFLARFSSIKGAHIALDVARRTRVPLDLVGDDRITGEPAYVQRIMAEAAASPNVKYVGPVSREKSVEFFSTGKALLHMNEHFREPFGLAPVEAGATGTPVIAWDNGAMRETIIEKSSGFLVKSVDQVVELVKNDAVSSLKAEACRESAARFTVGRMVDRMEELCKEAIDQPW